MRRRSITLEEKQRYWQRILGRLRRTNITMRHRLPTPEPFHADEGAREVFRPCQSNETAEQQQQQQQRDPLIQRFIIGPIPHPGPGPVYEISQTSIPSFITPTSDLIWEILDEIDRDPSPGRDVVGDIRPIGNKAPPPAYENVTPYRPVTSASQHSLCECNCELNPGDYVRMASQKSCHSSPDSPIFIP